MKHLPRQRGLWTPPPGVSTAVFGDIFEDFTQKSEKVDMWTSVCLIILKATTVHQHPGGGPESKTESSLSVGSCLRRWYIVGSPFTVHRSRFVSSAIKVFGYGHIFFNYLGGEQDASAKAMLRIVTMACIGCVEVKRQPIFHSASVAFFRWCVCGHGLHTVSSAPLVRACNV